MKPPCLTDLTLDRYHADELPQEEQASIRWHIESCSACAAKDASLIARREGLIASMRRLAPAPSFPRIDAASSAESPGPSIPGYRVVRRIDRGGQGLVFQAIQESTRRRVAIKVVAHAGRPSSNVETRFRREVQILAQLSHPNIVTIHDSGSCDAGFYYVMDFVEGERLDRFLLKHHPPLREILQLFIDLCSAVNHAHLLGVIHRDLKPENVLIDCQRQPRVLDFGLAKLTQESNLLSRQEVTETGQFLGSLCWASPEQAEASTQIDIRCDVYSIGVMLYQAITGKFPYPVDRSIREVLGNICNASPPKPSHLQRHLDSDVDTIVLKCLSKDPGRRYQSAGEVAADLARYLRGQAIAARADSGLYVFKKTLARHRTVTALSVVLILSLVVFGASAAVQSFKLAASRDAAVDARRHAEQQRDRADNEAERLRRSEYFLRMSLAESAYREYRGDAVFGLLDQCPVDLRSWEWGRLKYLSDASVGAYPELCVPALATAHDGSLIVVHGLDHTLNCFDPSLKRKIRSFPCPGPVTYLAEAADHIAVGTPGTTHFMDAQTGAIIQTIPGFPESRRSFAGNGRRFAELRGMLLCLDDLEKHTHREVAMSLPPETLAIDEAGTAVAVGFHNGAIHIYDFDTALNTRGWQAHQRIIRSLSFIPGREQLASGSDDKDVSIWNIRTTERVNHMPGHQGVISDLCASPDGRFLASASLDLTVRLWSIEHNELVRVFHGHRSRPMAVRFLSGSPSVVSIDERGNALFWDASVKPEVLTWNAGNILRGILSASEAAVFTPDARRIISSNVAGDLSAWDSQQVAKPLWSFKPYLCDVTSLAISPDGRWVAASSDFPAFNLFDTRTGQRGTWFVGHLYGPCHLTFSRDGQFLLSASEDRSCRLWDVDTGKCVRTFWHRKPLWTAALSSDGRHVAAGAIDGTTCVWDVATGRSLWSHKSHGSEVVDALFAPDNRHLLSCGFDGRVIFQDVADGSVARSIASHAERLYSLTFTPDLKRLVSTSGHNVEIWDMESGQAVTSFEAHSGSIHSACFSRDGMRFLTASSDGSFKVWPAASLRP